MTYGGRSSPESVPINEFNKLNTSFEQRETNSSIHFVHLTLVNYTEYIDCISKFILTARIN